VRYLELLVGSIFWWHPVAWWARRALRRFEEQCCDAWVLGTLPDHAHAYARALVKTVEFVAGSGLRTPALASGISETGSLKERLTMIMKRRLPGRPSMAQRVMLAVAAAAVLLVFPTWIDRSEASSGPEEGRQADIRHHEELRDLELEALELEQALQQVRTRHMQLQLEWGLSREQVELLEVTSREVEQREENLDRKLVRVTLDRIRDEAAQLAESGQHREAELLQREAEILAREHEQRAYDRLRVEWEWMASRMRELELEAAREVYEEAERLARELREQELR
jgi:hypothetical protein